MLLSEGSLGRISCRGPDDQRPRRLVARPREQERSRGGNGVGGEEEDEEGRADGGGRLLSLKGYFCRIFQDGGTGGSETLVILSLSRRWEFSSSQLYKLYSQLLRTSCRGIPMVPVSTFTVPNSPCPHQAKARHLSSAQSISLPSFLHPAEATLSDRTKTFFCIETTNCVGAWPSQIKTSTSPP